MCWLLHWPSCFYGPMPLSLSKSKEEIHRFICTSRWPNFLTIKYFTCRSRPDVPEVQISEDLAVNIALALRADINKALASLREIALGRNLKKFLGVLISENHFFSFSVAVCKVTLTKSLFQCFRWSLPFGFFQRSESSVTFWDWCILVWFFTLQSSVLAILWTPALVS